MSRQIGNKRNVKIISNILWMHLLTPTIKNTLKFKTDSHLIPAYKTINYFWLIPNIRLKLNNLINKKILAHYNYIRVKQFWRLISHQFVITFHQILSYIISWYIYRLGGTRHISHALGQLFHQNRSLMM
jgi:hypothetical protein